jgi:hypothetical protein
MPFLQETQRRARLQRNPEDWEPAPSHVKVSSTKSPVAYYNIGPTNSRRVLTLAVLNAQPQQAAAVGQARPVNVPVERVAPVGQARPVNAPVVAPDGAPAIINIYFS